MDLSLLSLTLLSAPPSVSVSLSLFFTRYKLKTKKSVSARFKRLGGGGLKYWRAGRKHNSGSKTQKQHRQLRKAGYAKGTMLKLLNRMLIGR
jgi:large subunit ribosomal protein L35